MQILSRVLLLLLAGVALGAPASSTLDPELPDSSEIMGQEDYDLKPTEVISRMEQDLGELNWIPTPHDGRVLTVPRDQWYKYVAIVKEEEAIKRNQKRQDPGMTRLPAGIDGRWAEYHCPSSAVEGTIPINLDTWACSTWSYTTGSQPIQIYDGSLGYNPDGDVVRYFYTYENWGGLSYAWNVDKCEEAIIRVTLICDDYNMGGLLNIYTAPQKNTKTRGTKALAFRVYIYIVAKQNGKN